MKKQNHPLRTRLTSLLLVLLCILGLFPTTALAVGDIIRLTDFGMSGVAYQSDALGRCTLHQMYFSDGSGIVTGFCGTKGGGMGNSLKGQTWGNKSEISDATVKTMMYAFVEVSAPAPYATLREPVFAHVDQATINGGGTVTVTASDKKLPNLTILKRDAQSGAVIPDTHFEIRGIHYGYHDDVTTGPDGTATLTGIPVDSYEVTEKSAPGFQMKEPTTQTVIIHGGESKTVVFQNVPLNAIIVEKYDSVTHEALPGCTFQLRYLGGTSGTGGTVIGQKVTGKNGTCIWTGLQPGTYIVEEVDPADGYSIIQASETVYLADNGEQSVITVRFDNAPDGMLLIRKVCAVNPGTTLQDAEFKITYADGTLIGDSNGIFVTDENGEIRIDGLKPGKSVIVTETRAPAGFIITECVSPPQRLYERRLFSLIRVAGCSMIGTVSDAKASQREYQEYVESWVHEVKTPITASRLVCRQLEGDTRRKLDYELTQVEAHIERALFYARAENPERDCVIRQTNLSEIVSQAVENHRTLLIQSGIRVETHGLDYQVYTDKKWAAFILGQLLQNAARYQGEEPVIIISAKLLGKQTQLTIQDNGIGIPAHEVQRVFDRGFTGSNGRTRGGSTGMGLYLCKKLSEFLELDIRLTSEEGAGTCVTLTFPARGNLTKL